MKTEKIKWIFVLCMPGLAMAGCAKTGETVQETAVNTSVASPAATSCETTFNAASLNMQKLCAPAAGRGKHFQIEGARLTAGSMAAIYLYIGGFTDGLENGSTAPATDAGKLRVLLYEGNNNPTVQYNNTTSVATTTVASPYEGTTAATVCADVTTDTPARVTLWVTGVNGADCANKSALTAANSMLNKWDWTPDTALVDGKNYVRVSSLADAVVAKVTVSTVTALTDTCETSAAAANSANLQAVCATTAGLGRHYRIEGAQTPFPRNHHAVSFYHGLATALTSAPALAAGDGQFQLNFYAGGSPAPAAVSYANYGTSGNVNTTTQYTGFTTAASTVCMDITAATPPRTVVWVNGVNGVDCSSYSTLTYANAIFDKADWTTPNNVALGAGNAAKQNAYVSISTNAGVWSSFTKVVASVRLQGH